ncbi:hypothetical protein TUM17379_27970 [Shewanella algae]|uniref:Uncharacterized protein n=1 Tax=Shewanella algae TaxID=38313 RepID=A0AAD1KAG2_9GAMM|nr:hypothetical protein TUM17379_27970 [Shewanella algae]
MGLGEVLKGLYALDLTAGILIQEVKADKVGIGGNTAAAKAIPTGSGYDPPTEVPCEALSANGVGSIVPVIRL